LEEKVEKQNNEGKRFKKENWNIQTRFVDEHYAVCIYKFIYLYWLQLIAYWLYGLQYIRTI